MALYIISEGCQVIKKMSMLTMMMMKVMKTRGIVFYPVAIQLMQDLSIKIQLLKKSKLRKHSLINSRLLQITPTRLIQKNTTKVSLLTMTIKLKTMLLLRKKTLTKYKMLINQLLMYQVLLRQKMVNTVLFRNCTFESGNSSTRKCQT